MGISKPQILFGDVMHRRLFPRENGFTYGMYYIALPLSRLKEAPISHRRFAPLSFNAKDHGHRDGSDLETWARTILAQNHMDNIADGEITLLTMPRIFGYVFNPVSFWLCHDKDGALRAVLCEVNNTFGQTHTYLCARPDQAPITREDVIKGDKVFHVSPFLNRVGHYSFRFDIRDDKCGIWIDYFNAVGDKELVTAVNGRFTGMTRHSLRKAFWAYPLVTLKAIYLIHWQAMKLVFKKIKYIPKPPQKQDRVSIANKITKP